jgi:amidase
MPVADGSDLGGSLRNPGNFNNVVGFRPSVGLTPTWPTPFPLLGFSVNGPLARTVGDIALLMSVMTGPDARDPSLLPTDPAVFRGGLERDFRGVRVAWCPDVGGLPVDLRVRAVLEPHRRTFERLGCIVEDACPDLGGADEVFLTIRGFRNAALYGPVLARYRDQIKPEAIAEIEAGAKLSGAEVARAMTLHAQLLERVRQFQERYAFMVSVVNQVPPFDATEPWPRSIDGVVMENYVAWMKTAYWISATCCPAISVPAGFTREGLPVGVQIVGRYRDDLSVLQLAYAFEQATGFGNQRPPNV